VARPPSGAETERLERYLRSERERFARQPELARRIARAGQAGPPDGVAPDELAAWTMLGNVLLNLDEALTKE
jgi:hypothetical protein